MEVRSGGVAAETSRRFLSLSAAVGVVLIVTVMVAAYGMDRLDRTVTASTAEIDRLTDMADAARIAQVTFKTQVQEWKNTLLRGYRSEDFSAYHDAFLARADEVDKQLAGLANEAQQLSFLNDNLPKLAAMHNDLDKAYGAALAKFVAADPLSVRAVDNEVRGRDRDLSDVFDAVVAAAKTFADERQSALLEKTGQVAASVRSTLYVSLGIGLLILVAATVIAMRAVRAA
jgi:hypothetical protein